MPARLNEEEAREGMAASDFEPITIWAKVEELNKVKK